MSYSPFHLHEQTGCIAATKLVWTAVILNGSGASGSYTNDGNFKSIARQYIKSFEGQKGGDNLSKPPQPPTPTTYFIISLVMP